MAVRNEKVGGIASGPTQMGGLAYVNDIVFHKNAGPSERLYVLSGDSQAPDTLPTGL